MRMGYHPPAMSMPQNATQAFPSQGGAVTLHGPAGRIEALCEVPSPAHARAGAAVICHPHPLHGGTMHNKVVTMVERTLRELGLNTVRFNFRGVGASEGTFDDGNGELHDLLAVLEWVRTARPHDDVWLAGFSFGSFVAAKAVRHVPVKHLITIAPPVGKYPFDALPNPNCPWLIVQGEDDDVVSAPAVFDWVASMSEPPMLVRMPDTGHFFHRRLMDLRGAIKNAVKHNLPPEAA
jgi:hypothetical protein